MNYSPNKFNTAHILLSPLYIFQEKTLIKEGEWAYPYYGIEVIKKLPQIYKKLPSYKGSFYLFFELMARITNEVNLVKRSLI